MFLSQLHLSTMLFVNGETGPLGYGDLDTLWDFTRRTLAATQSLQDKPEYYAWISTLALYVHCLNTWNLHLFPWKLGEHHSYADA